MLWVFKPMQINKEYSMTFEMKKKPKKPISPRGVDQHLDVGIYTPITFNYLQGLVADFAIKNDITQDKVSVSIDCHFDEYDLYLSYTPDHSEYTKQMDKYNQETRDYAKWQKQNAGKIAEYKKEQTKKRKATKIAKQLVELEERKLKLQASLEEA